MRALAFLFATLLVAAPAAAATAPDSSDAEPREDIGDVERASGSTVAIYVRLVRELSAGRDVFYRDVLATAADSRLNIRFADGSNLTLGDNSQLRIDDFVYWPTESFGRSLMNITRGVFRMVSGGLTKVADNQVEVRTPLATIGIHGTDFWGEQREDYLCVALLEEGGRLVIETRAGSVVLDQPGYAVVVTSADAPPSAPVRLTEAELAAARATVAWPE